MQYRLRHVITALVALAASGTMAEASGSKTWFVYCEGQSEGSHWAVLSRNSWQHRLTEDYGREVGRAARAFLESRHAMSLEGCSGVDFVDSRLAEHSRQRTAELHRKMGDKVYFITLPTSVLPEDEIAAPVAPPPPARTAPAAPEAAVEPEAAERQWPPQSPPD